jgi:uncharacterized protein YkwD
MPAEAAPALVVCPHCRTPVKSASPKTRWYYLRDKKKFGPYSWKQLLALAEQGKIRHEDLLLQEGTKKWVRAGTLRALFAQPVAITESLPIESPDPSAEETPVLPLPKRSNSWLIAGLAGGVLSVVLVLGLIAGYILTNRTDSTQDPPIDKQTTDVSKKEVLSTTTTTTTVKQEKKPTPEKKRLPDEKWPEHFLQRINRYRDKAGLTSVTLDEDLSRGCLAHAKYLARNHRSADAPDRLEEDPNKPGFSEEGQRAGQSAMIAFADPLAALELWMGRVLARVPLLSAELRSIGLGYVADAQGNWISVVDAVRGRDEAVIVFPAPKQEDVPVSFTAGPEVPDAQAEAGFPITVTFRALAAVTKANLDVLDSKGNKLEGWLWTPEKPIPKIAKFNTIAFISKGLLPGNSTYHATASAQVDGKPWKLAWSFTTEDDSDSKELWAKKVLAKVNEYREQAGLGSVVLDEKLSRGCLAHARYLLRNTDHPAIQGLGAHREDPKLPGFTSEGQKAGEASNIAIGDNDPLANVDAWMGTPFHRIPILNPKLKRVGFGCIRGRRLGWTTVLNVIDGKESNAPSQPVIYPPPGQKGVPVHFPNEGEDPNPIPDSKDGRAGYSITATFPEDDRLKNALGKLITSKGIEVPCWVSSPEKPANPKYPKAQGTTVCLIPKKPLDANTTYQVRIQGERGGKNWDKQWQFTTGDQGPSVADATRQVLNRLNHARRQAGLNLVVLDVKLSEGCQKHAEYLVKNADLLKERKASVLEEDPLLSDYSLIGALAAKQSNVFSNATVPVTQIDDLLATVLRRANLLDPNLQQIGFGCALDVGRGWRCVLNLQGGREEAKSVVYPAPEQTDIPLTSSDRIAEAKTKTPGFPITVTFSRPSPRDVKAVLKDMAGNEVDIWASVVDKTIAIYPLLPLRAGQTYSVTVAAFVNAAEWRQTWQFTTNKQAPR